jgi:hypothetical protein
MSLTSSPRPKGGPFFIIGAQRSGTTYLYDLLSEHPDIVMARPKRPEPKWFLDPAKAVLGPQAWEKALFPGVTSEPKMLGEKGTSYIENPQAAAAILSVFPEARSIVILREPVARALSNYRFSVENGAESAKAEEALDPNGPERPYDRKKFSASPFAYLRRGHYVDYLEGWARTFPKERTHVVLFEELTTGPKALEGLCDFLGLPHYRPETLGKVVNAAAEPMPELSPQLLQELRRHFEEPNQRLEKLLGRSLSVWKG